MESLTNKVGKTNANPKIQTSSKTSSNTSSQLSKNQEYLNHTCNDTPKYSNKFERAYYETRELLSTYIVQCISPTIQ